MQQRVLLYCQHLAGIGHVVRSVELARALHAQRWNVLLVCGGNLPQDYLFPPGVAVERLEPLQSDPEYQTLLPCAPGRTVDEIRTLRSARLLTLFDLFTPDAVITEMFPFGRRKFAFELLPLLERARQSVDRPLIVASVRDILVRRQDQEEYDRGVLSILNRYYGLVLVHSDEAMQPFENTFAQTSQIRSALFHTGYIVSGSRQTDTEATDAARRFISQELHGNPFITVSCGSGRLQAGQQLIQAVLRSAQAITERFPHEVLVCAGPMTPVDLFARYQQMASGLHRVHLVHHLPFLRNVLEHSSLSLCLGGYNTVLEALLAGSQTLIFPAQPNGDSEQRVRAESLAANGQLRLLTAEDLAGAGLVTRIGEALGTALQVVPPKVNGAETSACLLTEFFRGVALAQSAHVDARPVPFSSGRGNESVPFQLKGSRPCA